MTESKRLPRPPIVLIDRIRPLSEPETLSELLGPIAKIQRRPLPGPASGFSSSRHELLLIELGSGSRTRLRLKRTRIGEDWLSRRLREAGPGREAALLSEPSLAGVWTAFERPYLALAVEGDDVALLMEDYSEHLFPDIREPISLAAEEALLDAITKLHAAFWESQALGLPWLTKPEWYCDLLGPGQASDPTALEGAPEAIRDGVRNGWREALKLLPERTARRLAAPAPILASGWGALPRTLVHGDTKVANFALLPNGAVAAFDWTGVGAGPATIDLGWYLAVNSTRLAREKDGVIARYRALLESKLRSPIAEAVWKPMLDAGLVCGARMLLWSKALAMRDGTAARREDWNWWVSRLADWDAR